MSSLVDDDSSGFADVERAHVRAGYLPDFEWTAYPEPSPRNCMRVPLGRARVGLVDTSGAHVVGTPPVGSSGRAARIPVDAQIAFTHPGFDVDRALRDPEVVHPVHTLQRLADRGVIGEVAPITASVMGGVLIAKRLLDRGVPETVQAMCEQQVDLVLLVPV
jgi:hypothetical protein